MNVVKEIQRITQRELALGVDGSEKHSWHDEYRNSAYIYVGGLPFNVTEGDVLAVFSQYGEPSDINLIRDRETKKSKGFCFVAYEDQRSTILAVDNLNGITLAGRTIRVDHVKEYKHKEQEEKDGKKRETLHDRRQVEIKVLTKELKKELQTRRKDEKRQRRALREELRRKLAEEHGLPYHPKLKKEKKIKKEKKKKKHKDESETSSSSDPSEDESSDNAPMPAKQQRPAPTRQHKPQGPIAGAFDDVLPAPNRNIGGKKAMKGAFDDSDGDNDQDKPHTLIDRHGQRQAHTGESKHSTTREDRHHAHVTGRHHAPSHVDQRSYQHKEARTKRPSTRSDDEEDADERDDHSRHRQRR